MSEPPSDQNRRIAPRRRVLKGANIVFNDGTYTLPCRVKNISETGAQLEFDRSFILSVPDAFNLVIELDGTTVPCSVVRRQGDLVGVRFEGPITKTQPTRTQVVKPTLPQGAPSLRKKPITP